MENRKTAIRLDANNFALVSDIFRMVIEAAPQGGLSLADMRKRLPIYEKLDATGEGQIFKFSPQELVTLSDLYDKHRWGQFHKDILIIGEDLKRAKDTTK